MRLVRNGHGTLIEHEASCDRSRGHNPVFLGCTGLLQYQYQREGVPSSQHASPHVRQRGGRELQVAAQRRQITAAVNLLEGGQGPQGKKRRESPFRWADHLARLTEKEFKERYRLTYDAFYKLLEVLKDDLDGNEKKARNSRLCRTKSSSTSRTGATKRDRYRCRHRYHRDRLVPGLGPVPPHRLTLSTP